jgi:hypothetical protein
VLQWASAWDDESLSAPPNWPSPLLRDTCSTGWIGREPRHPIALFPASGWVGHFKQRKPRPKGLTGRQRAKQVEKVVASTHEIQGLKDTICDTRERTPLSPPFHHALSSYSAHSPAPISAFDCTRYKVLVEGAPFLR